MIEIRTEPNGEKSIFVLKKNILNLDEKEKLFNWLENREFKGGMTSWNKPIAREQLWFQEKMCYFSKDWNNRYTRWEASNYDDYLLNIQSKIQSIIDKLSDEIGDLKRANINSCLINKYRNNHDSIKPHRDNNISFGNNPTIIGLSLGSSRYININRIIYDENKLGEIVPDKLNQNLNLKFLLEDNSVFIMAGASQKYYSHEIPKEDRDCKLRYSLTFREYLY